MRSTRLELYLLVLLIVAGLIGCDAERRQASNGPLPKADQIGRLGTPSHIENHPEKLSGKMTGELASFYEAAEEASTLKEADRTVRALLSDSSSVPRYFREQMAAIAIFGRLGQSDRYAKNSLTPTELKVIGHYTQFLVENQSPESPMILWALKRLQDHWSDQRISEAAQTAAQAARAVYTDTESPGDPTSKAEAELIKGMEGHERDVWKAASELEEMASTFRRDQ